MNAPAIYPWARQSAGPSPLRRPGSVRRTTSIDVHWPDGWGQASIMQGAGRDVFTPVEGGAPVVLDEGSYAITASTMREILGISASPEHPNAQQMVGIRGGGASRIALGQIMGSTLPCRRPWASPVFLYSFMCRQSCSLCGILLEHWRTASPTWDCF